MNKIKEKLLSMGLNKGFFWILINRAFSIIKGPFSAIIQIHFLTSLQQGIWYTFSSLGALSVFAEMGFTQIVTQFISQDYAFLKLENGRIVGTRQQLDKFHSLINYSIKFFFFIIPVAIAILSIVGILFFKEESLSVIIAWLIYSVSGGIALIVSLFQAIYQGLDKVPEIQKNIFRNQLLATIINWGLLFCHAGIFSLALSNGIAGILTIFFLYRVSPEFWKSHFCYKCENQYKWGKEIVPLQLKYAVGFISSYFIYQLYVPAVYRVDETVLAGQLGMTMMLIGCIRSVSDAFLGGSLPRLNMLVAEKKENELLRLFKRLLVGALSVNILGSILVIIFLIILGYTKYRERFLSLETTLPLLLFSTAINVIGILGNYTLFHKDGSLYPLTIVAGLGGVVAMFCVYPFIKSLTKVFYILVLFYWIVLIPANVIAFFYKKKKFIVFAKDSDSYEKN